MKRSTATRLAPVLFWLFVLVGSYILFELAARYFAPFALEITTELDAALDVVDQEFGGDIDKFVARESDPAQVQPHPILGWDKPPVTYDSCAACSEPPLVILVLGDSVTEGHGVRVGAEDYTFLLSRLVRDRPVRIVNAGVGGFGVDQMVRKAEMLIDDVRPDVIVFAYIAHNLLRPGRQFIYLRNRPAARQTDIGVIWEEPGSDADYIARYRNYRDRFANGVWLGDFIWDNRRYYAPYLYRDFYGAVFDANIRQMRTLAAANTADLYFIRLPQSFRFHNDSELIKLIDDALDRQAATPGHPFSVPSIRDCVVRDLAADGRSFDIMGFHPNAAGQPRADVGAE
jgi:hypothetical protein